MGKQFLVCRIGNQGGICLIGNQDFSFFAVIGSLHQIQNIAFQHVHAYDADEFIKIFGIPYGYNGGNESLLIAENVGVIIGIRKIDNGIGFPQGFCPAFFLDLIQVVGQVVSVTVQETVPDIDPYFVDGIGVPETGCNNVKVI